MGSYPDVSVDSEYFSLYAETAIGNYADKKREHEDTIEWESRTRKILEKLKARIEEELKNHNLPYLKYSKDLPIAQENTKGIPAGPIRYRLRIKSNDIFIDSMYIILALSYLPAEDELQKFKKAIDNIILEQNLFSI